MEKNTTDINFYKEDIKGICRTLAPNDYDEKMLQTVEAELFLGFEFVRKYPKMVTIFGSARDEATAPYYESVRELARRLAEECGMTIATGGGPGIMQAANHGAYDADPKKSIAMAIKLPMEQQVNKYTNDYQMFKYFFTRKVMMSYVCDAFIAAPGGYGTFDELFGVLTLQQTNKANRTPIVLFGVDFWQPVYDFITETMEAKGFIDPRDSDRFIVTDSVDEVIALFKRLGIYNKETFS
jgi:uncharacterized protein (TIGR00730 family)